MAQDLSFIWIRGFSCAMTLCWGFVSLLGEGGTFGIFLYVLLGFGIFWGVRFFMFGWFCSWTHYCVLVLKQVFRLKMFLMLEQESHSNPGTGWPLCGVRTGWWNSTGAYIHCRFFQETAYLWCVTLVQPRLGNWLLRLGLSHQTCF